MTVAKMLTNTHEKLLGTIDEGTKATCVGRTKFWELINAGELETVRIGRRRMVVWSSVRAYVDRLREQAKSEAA